MSYRQFLDKLKATRRTWKYGWNKRIRQESRCCPITALHPAQIPAAYVSIAWEFIGLSERNAMMIMRAADNEPRHSKRVRRDLLKACGLKAARLREGCQ